MIVRELATQAVSATSGDPEGNAWTIETIYRLLDVHGSHNQHLQNPLNHPLLGAIKPRTSPLMGNEAVEGRFLVLSFSAHWPVLFLTDFSDLRVMEDFLLSEGGPLNSMATYDIAFIDQKWSPYWLHFTNGNGERIELEGNGWYHQRNGKMIEPIQDKVLTWSA